MKTLLRKKWIGILGALMLTNTVGMSAAYADAIEPTACNPETTLGGGFGIGDVVVKASSTAKVIAGVPAYHWYHGCGPTSIGSVMGFYDLNGYPNLFDASGDDVFLTENVKDHISSPAHNAKFNPTPDANLPFPPWDSIASFLGTSRDPLGYGESYISQSAVAVIGYAAYRGYQFDASLRWYNTTISPYYFNWDDIVAEIDAGRPLVFVVDVNGDDREDHMVPVVGYYIRGPNDFYYGIYTTYTEAEDIIWKPWQSMDTGNRWGVSYATFIMPLDAPELTVPVPGTALLLLTAVGVLPLVYRRM